MVTTTPIEFSGQPRLNPEKVVIITEWYRSALADSDKADDPTDGAFYDGQRAAWEDVLRLLYVQEPDGRRDPPDNRGYQGSG